MEAIVWVLFVLTAVLVSTVILLQEGKGGGLSEAFGGVGQQTFGVKAEGINKFTGWVTFVFVLLAIVITRLRSESSVVPFSAETPVQEAPASLEPGAPPEPAPAEQTPAGEPAPADQPPPNGGGQ